MSMIKRSVMPYGLEVSYNASPDDGPMLPVITWHFAVQDEDAEDMINELRESLFKLVDLTIEIVEQGKVTNG